MDYTNNKNSLYSRLASANENKESLYKIAFNNTKPKYVGIPLDSDEGAVYVEHEDIHSLINRRSL